MPQTASHLSLAFRKSNLDCARNVLFVGNNMLTGQNAYLFSEKITPSEGLSVLKKAVIQLKKELKSKTPFVFFQFLVVTSIQKTQFT